jgi:hypothetical protein
VPAHERVRFFKFAVPQNPILGFGFDARKAPNRSRCGFRFSSSKLAYFSSPLESALYQEIAYSPNRPSEILLPERLNQNASPPHILIAQNRAPRTWNPFPAVIALSSLPLGKKRLLFAFVPARQISPALRRLFASGSQNRCLFAFPPPCHRNHKQETNFSA